jgi:hypothetical protein
LIDHVDPYRCYLHTPHPEGLSAHKGHQPNRLDDFYSDKAWGQVEDEFTRLLQSYYVAATQDFTGPGGKHLPTDCPFKLTLWGEVPFKGLQTKAPVWLDARHLCGR